MRQRAKRHLGTYYYIGTLMGYATCGHKHATVRAALKCKSKPTKNPRVFMAHLGLLPAKILDEVRL